MKLKYYLTILAMVAILFPSLISAQEIAPKGHEAIDAPATLEEFKAISAEQEAYFNSLDDKFAKGSGLKPFKRWEAFYGPRLSAGEMRSPIEILHDYQRLIDNKNKNELQQHSANWQEIGPTVVHSTNGGIGRINCVEVHPTNSDIMWAGAAMGGAWKTTNRGASWRVADFTGFLSMGVSDIKYAKSNPEVIYLATGDANGSFMTNGYSIGVIKSVDAGKTWNYTGFTSKVHYGTLISSLYVDPDNEDRVLASTSEGIFRTNDGGEEWEQVSLGGLYRDLTQIPGKKNILLSSSFTRGGNAGIYRSTDAGESWNRAWIDEECVRVDFATTKANPNIVYMVAARTDTDPYNRVGENGLLDVYKSINKGETWEPLNVDLNLLTSSIDGTGTRGQGTYDLAIAVNPNNPNDVVVGGVNIWRTINGGQDWEIITYWSWSSEVPYVHADQHYFAWNNEDEFIVANDGGLYINADKNFDADSWEDVTDGISAGQFYKIAISNEKSLMAIVGTQDNGTSKLDNGSWNVIGGGDGMDCEINQEDSRTYYWSLYYGTVFGKFADGEQKTIIRSNITGEQAAWVAPVALDPTDNDIIYVGHYNVWKATDGGKGKNWNAVGTLPTAGEAYVDNIEIAEAYNSIIYASAENVLMRKIGNSDWKTLYSAGSDITSIKADKADPLSVWISISGFADNLKVFYLEDDGNDGVNVINKSSGIPNIPVNDLLILDDNETIFAGTDLGVFIKNSPDKAWVFFNQNMPSLVVTDLEYNEKNQTLYAGTMGRGLWQTKITSCNMNEPDVSIDGELILCEGDSISFTLNNPQDYDTYYWSTGDSIPSITVGKGGAYFLTLENSSGCFESSDVFEITVLDFREIKVSSNSGAYAFCESEDSIRLSANLGYAEYLWSTGETSKNIYISEPGDYWVECTAKNDCKAHKDITIVESSTPEVPEIQEFKDDSLFCITEAHSYQWFKNGSKIFGANDRTLILEESGSYSVEIENEAGCSAESEEVEMVVSVQDGNNDISSLLIYPNPNSGTFTIEMELYGNYMGQIVLMDINGNELRRYDNIAFTNQYSNNFDISDFPTGAYLIRLSVGENVFIRKIVKQ